MFLLAAGMPRLVDPEVPPEPADPDLSPTENRPAEAAAVGNLTQFGFNGRRALPVQRPVVAPETVGG